MSTDRDLPSNLVLASSALSYLRGRLHGARLLGMVVAVALMVIAGLLTNLPAVLLGDIVDLVIGGDITTFGHVLPILGLIGIIIGCREISTWIRKYIVERIGTALERDEFVSVIRRLLSIDLAQLIGERVGALNVRIHRSIEGVIRLVKLVFLDLLPTLSVAVVAIYMSFVRNWGIAVLMLIVAILGTIVTLLQIRSQKGIRVELFRAKEDIGASVTELLFGIDYVRASGAVQAEIEKKGELAEYLRKKEFTHHKWMMSYDSAKQLIEGAGFVGVIALGAWLAANEFVSKGEVLTFAVLFTSVTTPLRELHRIIDEGFEAALRIRDLLGLYELPQDLGLGGEVTPRAGNGLLPIIECSNLTVEYQKSGGGVVTALSSVDFTASPDEIIGVAGSSGSGKSTFAKVLLGLISTYSGSAQVFGAEIRDLRKESLAKLVAYVPQRPFLVKGSVRENVLYGLEQNISDGNIWQALEAAQIAEFVKGMPLQLEGEVAEQGRNLSGGECQRVVLARVFLRGAELVLLDEATAALDAVNERLVQNAIEELVKGKTAIIIAHRLSTLRAADRIVVFDGGRIVEDGPYEALIKSRRLFYRLVEAQSRK